MLMKCLGGVDEVEDKSIKIKFPEELKGQHFEQGLSRGINVGQS